MTDTVQILREPFGVVLIIGAWNFPFMETLKPLVGAIAAGNCAVVKPSELSPVSATLIASLLPKYLDPEAFQVVNGGAEETSALLKEKFDFIMYTGNSTVGRIVMRAASEHLTPVALELGGKSPTVVDSGVNIPIVARRIVWGKFLNVGQVCIAPDYILVLKDVHDQLVAEMKKVVVEFFGSDPSVSPDYGRIVNQRHFNRLKALMPSAESSEKIVCGGQLDENSLYIAPTIVDNVGPDSKLMKDEIFGPFMPIIQVESITEAIQFIRGRPKPLALYLFSERREVAERFKKETSSGGLTINDTLLHGFVASLPFGGVGESGMGAYGGRHSYETFSHERAVLHRSNIDAAADVLRFPPYSLQKLGWLKMLMSNSVKSSNFLIRNGLSIGLIVGLFSALYFYAEKGGFFHQ
eukprot:TRINITY_DN60_c0_g1_i3.p1 TRINITY_DN60_c0_g1~~TRINITY_DN60_c0_g1_i3.p1  ORF type:complete len:409 (-),score=107.38 TRINITY_DN60_c0_g1_i3:48-1274(-)